MASSWLFPSLRILLKTHENEIVFFFLLLEQNNPEISHHCIRQDSEADARAGDTGAVRIYLTRSPMALQSSFRPVSARAVAAVSSTAQVMCATSRPRAGLSL